MTLLLGFVVGIALVAPVGPVALTLFGLGAEQGRKAALAGAGGVVVADLVTLPIALGGAGALQAVDPMLLRGLEVIMGIALVVLAIAIVSSADRARSSVAGIRHPCRSLAAMTLVNPLSLVAWTGVALALPAAVRAPTHLVVFGLGLLSASAVWHTGLAAASGTFAPRLADGTRTHVTRVSGGVLAVLGVLLAT